MPLIMLGDVGFAKLSAPTSYGLDKKTDFAEHQVAEGKPLLQYMGLGLDSISLSFMFHIDFVNPQKAWNDLVFLLEWAEAFPVTMGNGLLMGKFVLTELNRTATYMSENGNLLGMECKATLREWHDPAPLKTRKVEKKKKAKAIKKKGKKRPKSKKATVPQLDAASKAAGYKLIDKKTVVRQA